MNDPYAIPALRVERLRKLADHVEALEHHSRTFVGKYGEPGFNLGLYQFDCGAPACIAGHAEVMFPEDPRGREVPEARAKTFNRAKCRLGLEQDEAHDLFTPGHLLVNLMDVPPEVAAAVLRRFADTGHVTWPEDAETYRGDAR